MLTTNHRGVKKSPSISILEKLSHPTLKGSYLILFISSNVSHLLRSTRGRDKLLGVVQYLADLYKQCMLDYLSSLRIRDWPLSVRNSKAIQESMKDGRKIFRLFRWMEELSGFGEKIRKPMDVVLILKLLKHFIGTIYYLIDNLLWIARIGVISKVILYANLRLESTKDVVAFARSALRILINLATAHKRYIKEKDILQELELNPEKSIGIGTLGYKNTNCLLKARQKRRFQFLEIVINIFKIISITKSLRLPLSKHMSNIFVSTCGLVSSCLSIFKMLSGKRGNKNNQHNKRLEGFH
ncbi:unnamed protein product [Blepharisma stoltei]|uniref:Uncharacterized protein n=1 Tax=Blepharisma stoltei TaxID=1481888 RepID=A0AAU9KB34_9CILI|nr:unnamed protein product [Blepharisma stoltei]